MAIWRRDMLGLGLAIAAAAGSSATAAPADGPVMESQDAWLDEGGRRHKMVFDTTTTEGLGDALGYGRNFYTANKNAYGVDGKDLSVVIIMRHMSTVFGFNDAMWAKYGVLFSERLKLTDPRTKAAPMVNLFNATIKDSDGPFGGVTLNEMAALGARFAVCSSATHGIAGMMARKLGGSGDAIADELMANLVSNGRMVPAGIVALNRAQEHGYAFSFTA